MVLVVGRLLAESVSDGHFRVFVPFLNMILQVFDFDYVDSLLESVIVSLQSFSMGRPISFDFHFCTLYTFTFTFSLNPETGWRVSAEQCGMQTTKS